jgi:hypothetical protein
VDLTVILTPQAAPAYEIVDDLFTGRRDAHEFTFEPQGATGTWTSLRLDRVDGATETIADIDPRSDLRPLLEFVVDAVPSQP